MVLQVLRRLVVRALLGGALLLVASLACTGGGEDTAPPSPTAEPAPTATPRTLPPPLAATPAATPTPTPGPPLAAEEYAEWCGNPPATGRESADELLDESRRIVPPPELRRFHNALVLALAASADLFGDDLPNGTLAEDSSDVRLAIALLVGVSLVREAVALPEDARALLEETGCIEARSLDFASSAMELGSSFLLAQILADFEPEIAQLMNLDQQAPSGRTLQDVLARGYLVCGVKQTQPLFGFKENDGSVVGFDIEFCKAIAAAVLGDATKVEYIDASDARTRFDLLVDMHDRRADSHDHGHRLARPRVGHRLRATDLLLRSGIPRPQGLWLRRHPTWPTSVSSPARHERNVGPLHIGLIWRADRRVLLRAL